jgi:adenosine deaminase
MMLNGIDGSWADEDRKRTWRAQWTAEFDSLARAAFQGPEPAGAAGATPF